jgi:hypothetical protein
MTILAFLSGITVGVLASIAYNYLFPAKFDRLTDKAADKVKGGK